MRTFEIKPLSVIIVHYGKDEHLFECLHSLSLSKPRGLVEIIVVNNTNQALGQKLLDSFCAREVFVGQNIGFGSAANRGAREARGEFFFFLNPDTRILLADTLERIIERMGDGENRQAGIIGSGLVGEDYLREHWGGGKAMRLKNLLLKRLFFCTKGKKLNKKELIPVDWVSGASFCIRREDFLSLDGFDESFFLYFEDMDLCLRMGRKKNIYYDGSVDILHYGGKSFSQKREQKRYYFSSQKRYFKKHRPSWESRIIEWLHRMFFSKF